MGPILVLNDREATAAQQDLAAVARALLPENAFALTRSGIAPALIEKHAEMLRRRKVALEGALAAYTSLKSKDPSLVSDWRSEPGVVLVLSRIFRGLSQRQLAEKLGMREQQVQRYEADRYRAISLSNLKRVCFALGVDLLAELKVGKSDATDFLGRPDKLEPSELRRVLAHVKSEGWLPDKDVSLSDAENFNALVNYATSVRDRFGGPAFLRKGQATSQLGTLSLHAWRARISDLAREKTDALDGRFDPTDISWVQSLVQLSRFKNGPLAAGELLQERGVLFFVVPSVPGTALDGAAFLEGNVPVIGLTMRYDRVDYFWFTLLHELGHIFLHLDHGLLAGFYDDFDVGQTDSIEDEANDFAASCIVAPELWRTSPARLAKTADVVESLARQLRIHPSLIFGKIRNERKDYRIFSSELGQGTVRGLFNERVKP